MKYIKFINDIAVEAPAKIQKASGTIFGYNNPENEAMLLADGYLKYTGNKPLSALRLVNGQIVEIEIEPVLPTKFSKLQIRRCLRLHNLEQVLEEILNANPELRAEWNDALAIDLNDEKVAALITAHQIPQEVIALIQTECEGI